MSLERLPAVGAVLAGEGGDFVAAARSGRLAEVPRVVAAGGAAWGAVVLLGHVPGGVTQGAWEAAQASHLHEAADIGLLAPALGGDVGCGGHCALSLRISRVTSATFSASSSRARAVGLPPAELASNKLRKVAGRMFSFSCGGAVGWGLTLSLSPRPHSSSMSRAVGTEARLACSFPWGCLYERFFSFLQSRHQVCRPSAIQRKRWKSLSGFTRPQ